MSDNNYDINTLRLISHNCNRNHHILNSILHTATTTADIVLIQEPGMLPHNN
jgi:hypothetical protein